ncbi:MAG: hypothetical protein ABI831_22005, partial [Betaproteobacteria bacterium]
MVAPNTTNPTIIANIRNIDSLPGQLILRSARAGISGPEFSTASPHFRNQRLIVQVAVHADGARAPRVLMLTASETKPSAARRRGGPSAQSSNNAFGDAAGFFEPSAVTDSDTLDVGLCRARTSLAR